MATFEEIKEKILRKNEKFIDRNFPANKKSLGNLEGVDDVVWKRPHELCDDPKFIVNDACRLDLVQGEIADCWFISAAACLAYQQPEDFKYCVPIGQSFDTNYAGIFLFRFWEFGSWTEVYIDDQLPTREGKLIFASNKQETNEFWVPLFEKAYAKLKGCYSYLDGGITTYALVDFTGGVSERVDLKAQRLMSGKLFETLMHISHKQSMMGCEIMARDGVIESKLSSGLYTGHAYSISKIIVVPTTVGTKVKLMRLRNPWGEGEWNGDWCDGSRRWNSISDKVKEELQLRNMEDGEFWMAYDDWIANFEYLTLCHMQPYNLTTQAGKSHRKEASKWQTTSYFYEWISGFNAGGSVRLSFGRDDFFTNPQYKLSIPSNQPQTTVIISLMQFSRYWDEQNIIAFDVYKIKEGSTKDFEESNYKKNQLVFAKTGCMPTKVREVTSRLELSGGDYIVIPYTMQKNQDRKFLLRIYTEVVLEEDLVFNTHTNVAPSKNTNFVEKNHLEELTTELFNKYSTPSSNKMDAKDLLNALDHKAKMQGWSGFSNMEASRCLVSIFGVKEVGFLDQEEFAEVVEDLKYWAETFKRFDADNSGSINYMELSSIYQAIGIHISYKLTRAIVGKYAGKRGEISWDEFALCSCRIKHAYEIFKRLSRESKLNIHLEEWMAVTLTL